MRLELRLEGETLTARIEAQTHAAKAVLLDHLPALRDRLAQHDIKIERLDVDLMQQPAGDPGDRPAGDTRGDQHRGHAARTGPRTTTRTETRPEQIGRRPPSGTGRLNVII